MADRIFSSWGGQVLDSRQGTAQGADDLPVPRSLPSGTPLLGLMGWDGIALWDDRANPIDMARAYAEGLVRYSCGQCVPCRVGSKVIFDALTRVCEGRGEAADVAAVERLAGRLRNQAMCDLGRSCGKAFTDFVTHFRAELDEAVKAKTPIPRGEYRFKLTAPCKSACPAHLDIPTYVELIKKGRFEDSLEVIRQDNCLPGTVGRVCVRPCEFNCRRQNVDGPIQIKYLKRFVADYELDRNRPPRLPKPVIDKEKVAIVGAGPAGLSCAYYLAQLGYDVTVFEALPEPGGMAAVGIPDYRLPRPILRREADLIAGMGVTIRYNTEVGRDVTWDDLVKGGFKAVFLGVGARLGTGLGVPGEEDAKEGFMRGADFLRNVALGKPVFVGKRLVVVGGGNVAIDCVRTGLRLGYEKVTLVYRRTEAEMPADKVEIADAKAEGIEFLFLTNPTRLILDENGKVKGVELIKMELGEPDESGRRRPVPVEGSEFVLETDAVIPAIGQAIDLGFLPEGGPVEAGRGNRIRVEGLNKLATVVDGVGVFSAGDCVTGPLTLIAGLAGGKEAAFQIDRFLREGRTEALEEWVMNEYVAQLKPYDAAEDVGVPATTEPAHIHHVPVEERIRDFREAEIGFTHEEAIADASRCLRCYRLLMVAPEPEARGS
ncbi:MAG: FAD-dependent oxidoreductase [Candidatus Dadabacteria bacterium]|nr:MAG: FAD-dependent oxidoreductase [Candidatus Dadabacteria bacterium]